jgi:hypothetical protein
MAKFGKTALGAEGGYDLNNPNDRGEIATMGFEIPGAAIAVRGAQGALKIDPTVSSSGGARPPGLSPDHMQIEQGLSDRLNAINKKIQDRDFTRPELNSLMDEKKDISDKLSQMVKLRNSLIRPKQILKTDEGIPKTDKIDGPVVKQREVIDYDLRKLTDDTYDYTDHSAPTGQMIKNPTKADLAKLSVIPLEKRVPGGGSKTAIRVIEDADGNVYAWNGWGAIHYELEQYLKTVTDGKFKSARDYYVEFGEDGKPYYYNEPDAGYSVEDYGKPYKMNPSQQQQSNAGGSGPTKDTIGVEAPAQPANKLSPLGDEKGGWMQRGSANDNIIPKKPADITYDQIINSTKSGDTGARARLIDDYVNQLAKRHSVTDPEDIKILKTNIRSSSLNTNQAHARVKDRVEDARASMLASKNNHEGAGRIYRDKLAMWKDVLDEISPQNIKPKKESAPAKPGDKTVLQGAVDNLTAMAEEALGKFTKQDVAKLNEEYAPIVDAYTNVFYGKDKFFSNRFDKAGIEPIDLKSIIDAAENGDKAGLANMRDLFDKATDERSRLLAKFTKDIMGYFKYDN